ncbi:hypothetical protein EDF56_10596 [Novosphingobium sp. PhB165]|nr:hypothetical protein EDF56_10596 [Novosphingobium sp. PhB165]
MITMLAELIDLRRASGMFERNGGVDQSAIEENPARIMCRVPAILQCEGNRAFGKGGRVHPWQHRSIAFARLGDDAAARFFDNRMPAPRQFGEQR